MAQLLRLHERSLKAHRRSDAAMLVGDAPGDFLVVSRGSVTTVTRAQMLQGVSVWVSLYEKRTGRWVSVGNASNFRE